MTHNSKIYVAGHSGMVGSASVRELKKAGYSNIIVKSSNELDLRNQKDVEKFIFHEKPEIIIDAAAKVGGILANDSYPFEFLMNNMLIQNNLINSAYKNNVSKFIFLGSSCIYPKFSPQPIKEKYLLTGPLEPTNQWYAIAKISGVKLIESLNKQYNKSYISLMPTNLYGPNDNFDLKTSHVLPAMIRKFHDAKLNNNSDVILWGSGKAMREFLHVDDLAKAIVFSIKNNISDSILNVGTGKDIFIKELAELVQTTIGHKGKIIWDTSKPDGTPKKLLDISKINDYGWSPNISLKKGIKHTLDWYLKQKIK